MFLDNSLIEFISCVSKYNQIKANKEVRGIEATIPAKTVDLFAISDIKTTTKAVNINFIKTYIKLFHN